VICEYFPRSDHKNRIRKSVETVQRFATEIIDRVTIQLTLFNEYFKIPNHIDGQNDEA
jgi:hypothetical protein